MMNKSLYAIRRPYIREGVSDATVNRYINLWFKDIIGNEKSNITRQEFADVLRTANSIMRQNDDDYEVRKGIDFNREVLEYMFQKYQEQLQNTSNADWRLVWERQVRGMIDQITGNLSEVEQKTYDELGIRVYQTNERYMVSSGREGPTEIQKILRNVIVDSFSNPNDTGPPTGTEAASRPKAVIVVKSPPGTGKTDLLFYTISLITELLSILPSVMIPTSRQLHASDIVSKLAKDLRYKAYKILHYKNPADSGQWGKLATMVVCQMESLCKVYKEFSGAKNSDSGDFSYWKGILYLDEISALFKQFISKTMNGRILSVMGALGKLCSSSRVILVSDADISLPILRNMRMMLGPHVPMHLIMNDYKPPAFTSYILASNLHPTVLTTNIETHSFRYLRHARDPGSIGVQGVANTLRYEMDNVRKYGPVFFVTGVKREGASVVDLCIKEGLVKESEVLFIHGENAQTMRKTVFKDISAAVRDKLLVVYTSAITQGVDINETIDRKTKQVIKVYAYRMFLHIDSFTCTVRDCLQMVGRARNRIDKNLYITISDSGVCWRTPILSYAEELRDCCREWASSHGDEGKPETWNLHVLASMKHEDNLSRSCLRNVLEERLKHLNGSLVNAFEIADASANTLEFQEELPECLKLPDMYLDNSRSRGPVKEDMEIRRDTDEPVVPCGIPGGSPGDIPLYEEVEDRDLEHIVAIRNRLHMFEDPSIREQVLEKVEYEQLKYDLKPFLGKCSDEDKQAVWDYTVKNKGFKDHLVKACQVMQAVHAYKCGRDPDIIEENRFSQVGKVIHELGQALEIEDLLDIQGISRDKWDRNVDKVKTVLQRADVQQLFKVELSRLKLESKNTSLSVKSGISRILKAYSLVSIYLNDKSDDEEMSPADVLEAPKKRKRRLDENGKKVNVTPVAIKSKEIPGTAYRSILAEVTNE